MIDFDDDEFCPSLPVTIPSTNGFLPTRHANKFQNLPYSSVGIVELCLPSSVTYSIPDFDDLPSLISENTDSECECECGSTDAVRYSKLRNHKSSLPLTECIHDHPLTNIEQVINVPSSVQSKNHHPIKAQNEKRRQDSLKFHNPESILDDLDLNKKCVSEREMTTLSIRTSRIATRPCKRSYRSNPLYLRIYAAEKRMLESGKIHGISCGPILAPREDLYNAQPQIEILGIACRWHKRKSSDRSWRALNLRELN